jgi:hypothetical protein
VVIRVYVPVRDIDRHTSYFVAPVTFFQVILMLEEEARAAFTDVGIGNMVFADTAAEYGPKTFFPDTSRYARTL